MIPFDHLVRELEQLTADELLTWIERGWVRPEGAVERYYFSEVDAARCRLIDEMKRECAIADDTIPVILSLLDEVYGLRHRLKTLLRAVERQPNATRDAIARAIGSLSDNGG